MARDGLSICILGDLNLEMSAVSTGITFRQLSADRLMYSPVCVSVGGTGANLALAATAHFRSVDVLGHVGDDEVGALVAKTLSAAGVKLHLRSIPGAATGCVLYVRDSSTDLQQGIRLLIVDRGANRLVTADYIAAHADNIRSSDILFLDGYSLIDEPRRAAAERAMSIAKQSGTKVAFDLVPHEADRYFTKDQVVAWMASVDVLIAEVRTVRRVHGFESDHEVIDSQTAYDTCRFLCAAYPGRTFLLRFGSGNIEHSLLCEAGGLLALSATGYSKTAEPRGFGDRLTAADLAGYLTRLRGSG